MPGIRMAVSAGKPNRVCGSCTLCCRLVPVEGLGKAAGQRCRYQGHRGCKVYATLNQVSPECRLWSCRWLVDLHARELHRPDRVHYVIDIMPDFVGAADPGGGEPVNVPVMQVWADPAYPDAWRRDAALRRYMITMAGERGEATLVRLGNRSGLVIFPPNMMADGEWCEKTAGPSSGAWRNPLDDIRDAAGISPERDSMTSDEARARIHARGRAILSALKGD
jgi:hypothetical protein